MKKYILFLFALIMIVGCFVLLPERAAAEVYSGSCGENVKWTYSTVTKLLRIYGSGPMDDYYDSGMYLSRPWSSVVIWSSDIDSIIIEEGVTSIGYYAFRGTDASSISISNSVVRISRGAFPYDPNLGSRVYHYYELAEYLGNDSNHYHALLAAYNRSITSCTIHPDTKVIADGAFTNCTKLTSITIPDGVTHIGSEAFSGCSGLKSITLPNSVVSIGEGAFSGCRSLSSITIPDGVTSIGDSAFYGCKKLTTIKIPDAVTSIGDSAFYQCSGLTSITIPDNVTSIGDYAFYNCTNLASVTIGNSLTDFGREVFRECTALSSVSIRDGAAKIGTAAFCDCTNLSSVTIPNSVKIIGENAFQNCTGLTSIVIPEGVEIIGSFAFYGCAGLTSIVIPESVEIMGSFAFSECSIPYNNYRNGKYLGNESNPYHVLIKADGSSIHQNTKVIAGSAFADRKISSITIPDGVISIGDSAFSGCTGLTSIAIPDSVKSIEDYAFSGCSALGSITISDSLTNIGNGAFQKCGLSSITIPNRVTNIGEAAFYCCEALASIQIPNNVTSIGGSAFYLCRSLYSVIIGNGITRIENDTFSYCMNLTSITIPSSVTSIGDNAFSDCDRFETVYYGGSEVQKGLIAIGTNNRFLKNANWIYPIQSISVLSLPNQTEFFVNDSFSCDGLSLSCLRENGLTTTISNGFLLSEPDMTNYGTKTVTVFYHEDATGNDFTTSFEIKVYKRVQSAALHQPTKKQYEVGEELDLTGLYFYFVYDDGTSEKVTDGFTITGFDANAAGEKSVTVTCRMYESTFAVTVVKRAFSLAVRTPPTKTKYELNENFSSVGLSLTLTYNDGTTEIVSSGFDISGFSSVTAGEKTVVVSYGGFETTFTVTVVKRPASLAILTPVTKTRYEVNEAFSSAGLTLTLTYNDGTTDTITEGFETVGFDSAKGGVKTVTVTCSGVSTTFTVEVIKRLSSSVVNSMPAKEVYRLFEAPDLSGMSVTLNYNDGTTETVASGFEVEDFDTTEEGDFSALVIYGPFMTFYDYTVEGVAVETPGDLDGNEGVTSADAIYLLYHTFYPEDYPIAQDCDYNGDGVLTSADAIYLLYYTFYPEDYPLEHTPAAPAPAALPPKREDLAA